VGGGHTISDSDEERVVDAYASVRGFAFVVADTDMDPDDLMHDALVRLMARGQTDDIDDLEAYLRRSVLNAASNQRRSFGMRSRLLGRLSSEAHDPTARSQPVPSDLGDLMRLGAQDRAALFLFAVEGRPHREVASALGVSETAARARVSRALRRLRVELADEAKEVNRRGHDG